MITYTVPWNRKSGINYSSLDMILSQAVIQHIDNLDDAFEIMAKWLKPGGLMSHVIDLTSVGSSPNLQGHWEYSEFEWKVIRGRLKYLLNREPYSKIC
jgi:SAM-dependent methyltransferase